MSMDEVRYRAADAEDFAFLAAMLGEAAVWRPDKPTPTAAEVMAEPHLALPLRLAEAGRPWRAR
jgi:hypothetical protein